MLIKFLPNYIEWLLRSVPSKEREKFLNKKRNIDMFLHWHAMSPFTTSCTYLCGHGVTFPDNKLSLSTKTLTNSSNSGIARSLASINQQLFPNWDWSTNPWCIGNPKAEASIETPKRSSYHNNNMQDFGSCSVASLSKPTTACSFSVSLATLAWNSAHTRSSCNCSWMPSLFSLVIFASPPSPRGCLLYSNSYFQLNSCSI